MEILSISLNAISQSFKEGICFPYLIKFIFSWDFLEKHENKENWIILEYCDWQKFNKKFTTQGKLGDRGDGEGSILRLILPGSPSNIHEIPSGNPKKMSFLIKIPIKFPFIFSWPFNEYLSGKPWRSPIIFHHQTSSKL